MAADPAVQAFCEWLRGEYRADGSLEEIRVLAAAPVCELLGIGLGTGGGFPPPERRTTTSATSPARMRAEAARISGRREGTLTFSDESPARLALPSGVRSL